jgi:hypothetical protein
LYAQTKAPENNFGDGMHILTTTKIEDNLHMSPAHCSNRWSSYPTPTSGTASEVFLQLGYKFLQFVLWVLDDDDDQSSSVGEKKDVDFCLSRSHQYLSLSALVFCNKEKRFWVWHQTR